MCASRSGLVWNWRGTDSGRSVSLMPRCPPIPPNSPVAAHWRLFLCGPGISGYLARTSREIVVPGRDRRSTSLFRIGGASASICAARFSSSSVANQEIRSGCLVAMSRQSLRFILLPLCGRPRAAPGVHRPVAGGVARDRHRRALVQSHGLPVGELASLVVAPRDGDAPRRGANPP